MANDLNITPSAYSKIERGITDPSVGRLAQIATILGVDITYFFQGEIESKVEERFVSYGYATKTDVEELSQVIQQLKDELLLIKKELKTNSASTSKKKK